MVYIGLPMVYIGLPMVYKGLPMVNETQNVSLHDF